MVNTSTVDRRSLASRAERLAVGVLLAAGATALVSWFLVGQWVSPWWLVVAVALPAAVAVVWATRRSGWLVRLADTAVVLVVCSAVAWLVWSPLPHRLAVLEAHRSAADATAQRLIAANPPTGCRPPRAGELGVLAQLGPWAEVCFRGLQDGSLASLDLDVVAHSTAGSLTYSAVGWSTSSPDSCYRHVVGHWYIHALANLNDPADPCPYGYRFEGGGSRRRALQAGAVNRCCSNTTRTRRSPGRWCR